MKFVTLDNLRKVWANFENKIEDIKFECPTEEEIDAIFEDITFYVDGTEFTYC